MKLTALLCTASFAATLGLSTMVAPNPALADGDESSEKNPRRAKQLYELGKRLFAAKEFAEAAKTFAESFGFDPRPAALFNQGRCLEEHGDKEAAISAYKRYLVLEPTGEAAEEAETRSLALERKIELEKNALGEGTGTTGKAGQTDGSGTGNTDVGTGRSDGGGKTLRTTGLATVGVGALVFVTGGYFGLKARSIAGEFDDHQDGTPWTQAEVDRFNDGERAEIIGVSMMALGTAVAIGGGVMYYLGRKEGSKGERRVEVAPTVSPDSAGAQVRIQF